MRPRRWSGPRSTGAGTGCGASPGARRAVGELVAELADRFPVEKAVLFGSWATGRFTVASDVDLLVVYRGERRSDAYSAIRRAVDVRGLEPHPVPEAEYARRRGHFDRMTAGGVVVYGDGEA